MNLYVESSAVLAWLLVEPMADPVLLALGEANTVVTSELTLIECRRSLLRAADQGRIREAAAADLRRLLENAARGWVIVQITKAVADRASGRFADEPLRTLDAIHVATALLMQAAIPELGVLSLDRRVRSVAVDLGFRLLPV